MNRLAALKSVPYRRIALALGVGATGGAVFALLDLPLPWMLGSLFACLLASLTPAPVTAPPAMRPPMSAVIGVMLGAAYTPDLLAQIGSWPITLLGMICFLVTAGAVCIAYFRFVAGFDLKTSYFSGMPGGLVEMVLLGEQAGADSRRIALVQAGRIVFTIFTIPFIVRLLSDETVVAGESMAVSLMDMDGPATIWFFVSCIGGVVLGHVLRLPAKYLMGPMIVSMIVHVFGWSTFKAPWEVVILAQIVLGTTVGCRFAGTRPLEILRILCISLGAAVILLGFSVGFAWGVAQLTGYSAIELLLAYAPGGLTEMGLLALALNLEIALVSTHHILRIFLVTLGAGLLMPLFGIKRKV